MKLAVVVQRYAADIGGGSELHARYIAEHLAGHADVRVLTTCARDYVTWKNEYPAGETRVHGIPVERFPVAHERDSRDFARRSSLVFEEMHSVADELAWLDSQGPVSPALIERVRHVAAESDFVVLFSLRYHTAFHGARAAAGNAVLVPTTERDPALGLADLRSGAPRGPRHHVQLAGRTRAHPGSPRRRPRPGVTVGVGSQIPAAIDPSRAAAAFGLDRPYLLYVGRIDVNKGCAELFDYFSQYAARSDRPLDLVLIGTPVLPIPDHPRIRHLGYVSDQDKYDVLAGAEALVMPSYFESLSMVMLEAWAIGVPVLANGRCDVLAGQCLRSNGGLFYSNGREFEAMLDTLLDDPALADELGENGRAFYDCPLRLAGGRACLSGHVRAAGSWRSGQPDGTASGMAGRPPAHRAAWRRCRGRGPTRTGPDGREERDRVVKLAFITPRYGADLIAGPEHACRLLAEHTGHRHDIDVLTTCALDSRTWKNEYPEGPDRVRGVRVRRFPVTERDPDPAALSRLASRLLAEPHSQAEELDWVRRRGPWAPGLLDHLKRQHRNYDALVFFGLNTATTVFGMATGARAQRALPAPRAQGDIAAGPLGRAAADAPRARTALHLRAATAPHLRARAAASRRARRHRRRAVAAAGVSAAPAGSRPT